MAPTIVTAAIVERDGRFLVTRRLPGTHLAGLWEFPGGKCQPGESLADCLARELREELDVAATIGREVFTTTHEYAERSVQLHFLECAVEGEVRPLLGQEVRWVARDELDTLDFPPADAALLAILAGGK